MVAFVATIAMAIPAQAGFRIGPRVGVAISRLHFNKEAFSTENRAGFTAGLEAEIGLPLGICVDGSVMYVRRSLDAVESTDATSVIKTNRDYISVPINLKWRFGLPIVGKIISPYIFTGPDFAFLTSKQAISDAWKSHKVDVSWNIGVGVELVKHLQIGASYGLGITKLSHIAGITSSMNDQIQGKNNFWTVTAAWLF